MTVVVEEEEDKEEEYLAVSRCSISPPRHVGHRTHNLTFGRLPAHLHLTLFVFTRSLHL